MDINQAIIIDNAGVHLLKKGCRVQIGMPAWGIKDLVSRDGHPLSPADIVGFSERFQHDSILSEYERKLGYHFSWGTLNEFVTEDEEELEDEKIMGACFDFAPRDVFLEFPDSGHLADLFNWMYHLHPRCHPTFVCDEVSCDWTVINFLASDEQERRALRNWLADVFLPLIWPDLLAEAMKIIANVKAGVVGPNGSLEELLADRTGNLLCGDPTSLSFYKEFS